MDARNDGTEATRRHCVFLGLGSNIGDRRAHLRFGLHALDEFVAIERVSSVYDTAPLLLTAQPRFYNIACMGLTALAPLALLRALKEIERRAGRTGGVRYGPRPIDIDILFYDELLLSTPELTIPHPGIAERAFVLEPLAELAPQLRHPALGQTVATLAEAIGPADVTRLGPL